MEFNADEFRDSIKTKTLDELRRLDAELTTGLNGHADEIRSLADLEDISAEDDEKLTATLEERELQTSQRDVVRSILAPLEERAKKIEEIRAMPHEAVRGFDDFSIRKSSNPFDGDPNRMGRDELRDRALKAFEQNGGELRSHQGDHLDSLLRSTAFERDGSVIAKRLLVTERPEYRSAFMKGISHANPAFSPEEARALDEFRAMNEGTAADGGYGIPVLIDPTIILTSGAADAPILRIARMITITTNEWKGVTSPGTTWSFDAEAAEVSDDSITLTQPAIPTNRATGFIPYSIEVGQDYPGFAAEMRGVLDAGYVDLIASKSMTGSGSTEMKGVFTAIAATAASLTTVTTKGSIGPADIRKAWAALPERYRARATWLMNLSVENQLVGGTGALSISDYSVFRTANGDAVLTGRPVVTTDYAPAFTGTTSGTESFALVGDFSRYAVVQRAGMSVELVPHLFGTANNRPTGQRGWFAYARLGSDAIDVNAFRLLSNT